MLTRAAHQFIRWIPLLVPATGKALLFVLDTSLLKNSPSATFVCDFGIVHQRFIIWIESVLQRGWLLEEMSLGLGTRHIDDTKVWIRMLQ